MAGWPGINAGMHSLPLNRRAFLQRSALAVGGLVSATAPAADEGLRIVDTHTHFYDPTRPEGVPWPPKGSPLYRTVLPQDWLAVATPLGVRETVVVEASRLVEDNAWILELAAREKCIVGFVGNLLPHDPDFAKHLKRFAANPVFRGIRVSNAEFSKNVQEDGFRRGLALLAELGLSLDVNGPAAMLPAVAQIAGEMPELRIMVDHAGSAGDPQKLSGEWRDAMRALGRQRNVWCKVSALIEQTAMSSAEFGKAPRDTAFYAPILDHCWDCFGEERLVYGSNWPVSEKGGTYADQFRIVNEYFGAKGAGVIERVFSKNSRAVYRWVERA